MRKNLGKENMYNNETTYNDVHNTPENNTAYSKLESKFFDRSECVPSCPVAWASEVLELLEYLDKEFGIERNTTTLRGYYMQGTWYDHLFGFASIKSALNSAFFYFIQNHADGKSTAGYIKSKSTAYKLKQVFDSFIHPYQYGYQLFKGQVINPILNRINKPKIRLGQVKEKFGSFRLYFSAPDYLSDHIDQMVMKTEIQLSLKGVYLPIESFYYLHNEYYMNNEYNPNDIVTKKVKSLDKTTFYTKVQQYNYRKLLKDLGADLQVLRVAADEKAKKNKNKKRTPSRAKK